MLEAAGAGGGSSTTTEEENEVEGKNAAAQGGPERLLSETQLRMAQQGQAYYELGREAVSAPTAAAIEAHRGVTGSPYKRRMAEPQDLMRGAWRCGVTTALPSGKLIRAVGGDDDDDDNDVALGDDDDVDDLRLLYCTGVCVCVCVCVCVLFLR
eukprot:SAG25_NODE_6_length_29267_cov_21.188803_21_plen_154_part_00